jgi:hypothetical protein
LLQGASRSHCRLDALVGALARFGSFFPGFDSLSELAQDRFPVDTALTERTIVPRVLADDFLTCNEQADELELSFSGRFAFEFGQRRLQGLERRGERGWSAEELALLS